MSEETIIGGLPLGRFVFFVTSLIGFASGIVLVFAGILQLVGLFLITGPLQERGNEINASMFLLWASVSLALSIPGFAAAAVLKELAIPGNDGNPEFNGVHHGFCAASVPALGYAGMATAYGFIQYVA